MHTTYQVVLAVSKPAPKVEDAKPRKKELTNQNPNSHLKEQDAGVKVESLYTFELFHEISFFFHEASFFFGAVLLHFGADFLEVIFSEDIFFGEKVFDFFSCSELGFGEVFFGASASAIFATAASTFVAGD